MCSRLTSRLSCLPHSHLVLYRPYPHSHAGIHVSSGLSQHSAVSMPMGPTPPPKSPPSTGRFNCTLGSVGCWVCVWLAGWVGATLITGMGIEERYSVTHRPPLGHLSPTCATRLTVTDSTPTERLSPSMNLCSAHGYAGRQLVRVQAAAHAPE